MNSQKLLIPFASVHQGFSLLFEYADNEIGGVREIYQGYLGSIKYPRPYWNTSTGRAWLIELSEGEEMVSDGGDDYTDHIFIPPTAWLFYEKGHFSPFQLELTDIDNGKVIVCNFTSASPTYEGSSKVEVSVPHGYLQSYGEHKFISNPPPDGFL